MHYPRRHNVKKQLQPLGISSIKSLEVIIINANGALLRGGR